MIIVTADNMDVYGDIAYEYVAAHMQTDFSMSYFVADIIDIDPTESYNLKAIRGNANDYFFIYDVCAVTKYYDKVYIHVRFRLIDAPSFIRREFKYNTETIVVNWISSPSEKLAVFVGKDTIVKTQLKTEFAKGVLQRQTWYVIWGDVRYKHREGGPALREVNVPGWDRQEWWWLNKLHREDGPAQNTVPPSYFYHGRRITWTGHTLRRFTKWLFGT